MPKLIVSPLILIVLTLALGAPAWAQTSALAENALIAQLNAATQAGRWQEAADAAGQLVAIDPKERFYEALGAARMQLGAYAGALESFDAALAAIRREAAGGQPPNADLSRLLTERGNALLKLKRYDEAMAAYSQAAPLAANPGRAWFNVCATAFNIGRTDDALGSCGKAVAADPARADAWFVLGSVLFSQGTVDKDGRYILPPGTLEALQRYQALAPTGPHAADVKAMLDAAGQK